MADERGQRTLPALLRNSGRRYPNARYELNWENPLQLLVATILAAQCTDERVNAVTPSLFAKYPDAKRSPGLISPSWRKPCARPASTATRPGRSATPARRSSIGSAASVPADIDDLTTLPGVARKTANVVLNNAFRIPSGVIVDTHVARVSQRLGLTDETKPERIEADLMKLLPREEWIPFGAAVVLHGRYVCTARDPQCSRCILEDALPEARG